MLANPTNLGLIDIYLDATNRYGTKMSPWNRSVSFVESQQHVIDPTNPGGALDDGVKDRLHVRGSTTDDAEHLSGCCLMLQCLAQFCITFLDLPEQPDVLDGDDSLIGEGLEQTDLLFGEGSDFVSTDMNRADSNSFKQQRGR